LTILLEQVWFDVKVLDGAAIVHLFHTTNPTFSRIMPMSLLFLISVRIFVLASMLMWYGMNTSEPVSRSQQGRSKEMESKGR